MRSLQLQAQIISSLQRFAKGQLSKEGRAIYGLLELPYIKWCSRIIPSLLTISLISTTKFKAKSKQHHLLLTILFYRPDYPPDSNVSLVDLLHKMFIKDANDRISLDDIMKHDWVTSNGINPMPRTFYPKVELT